MTHEKKIITNAFRGQLEEIRKLLKENEVNINTLAFNGGSALHYAMMLNNGNNLVIVKWLLAEGVDYQIKNKQGKTPLDLARMFSMTEVVKCLELDENGIPAHLNQLHQRVSNAIHESKYATQTRMPKEINHIIMSFTFKFFKPPKPVSNKQTADNEQHSVPSSCVR